ncbi:acyl-CoA dehydrogenase family protein [Paraburkholderia sp. 40]|uniref:acyl-CoA dehydrogenase family protein n=1 Tax=Paraburkholderia sp. 40 TaxID=2991059 RepID=UPI003D26031A
MYVSNAKRRLGRADLSFQDLIKQVKELRPLIEESAPSNEARGMLAPAVVDAFAEMGLFGYFAPKEAHGWQLSPVEALELIETVAEMDGPTAWVLFATGLCTSAAGAFLGDSAVEAMFGSGLTVAAGQGIPNGKATAVPGGYRLTGKWSYGSGIKHAHYVHAGAIVYEEGRPRMLRNGTTETLILNVPRENVNFHDNWDVIGLRATGSIDYSIDDVFVPEDFCYTARVVEPLRGGWTYRTGAIGIGTAGHTAFALGQAKRILDETAALARAKAAIPNSIASSSSFLEGYAWMEARVKAARALAFETWASVEKSLREGEPFTTRHVTLIRLALNHATWTAVEACDFAFKAAGGVSLRNGIIQRIYRDMHAGSQHITSSPVMLSECGKELAGLAPGKQWSFLGLVDAVAE